MKQSMLFALRFLQVVTSYKKLVLTQPPSGERTIRKVFWSKSGFVPLCENELLGKGRIALNSAAKFYYLQGAARAHSPVSRCATSYQYRKGLVR